MTLSRRTAFAQIALAGLISSLLSSRASAEVAKYTYDALGRVTQVQYSDGSTITYTYDSAGNRTQVVRSSSPPPPPSPPPPSTFTQTIQITGTAPVNLRALADVAGFTGAQNATITFEVGNGVTITGAAGQSANFFDGGIAIDTGTWPGGYTIALTLTIKNGGIVRGGGGTGGYGGVGDADIGGTGGAGGDAIFLRTNMTGGITIQSGGQVRGGGGGGHGGQGAHFYDPFEPRDMGGGGGGGGKPNGAGGAGGGGSPSGSAGTAGTPTAVGTGGASPEALPGKNGGDYGAAGQAQNGVPGGPGGYAIRKNGFTATVTNNGTVSGTIG